MVEKINKKRGKLVSKTSNSNNESNYQIDFNDINHNEINLIPETNDTKHFFISYVMLKIQCGDWKIGKNIISEKSLSEKLGITKTRCHFLLSRLEKSKILKPVRCKYWIVDDYLTNNSILSLDPPSKNPYYFHVSVSKKWLKNINELLKDSNVFNDFLQPNTVLNFDEFFYCKKIFYEKEKGEKTRIFKMGFAEKLFFNWDKNLIKNDILKFLAVNGHIVLRCNTKIVICKDNDSNITDFDPVIYIYKAVYNQNNDLIMISRDSHSRLSEISISTISEAIY
ncbi:hypothetical protein MCAV_00650 [[Mycoplasma] cavipharyngis]|uniref:hypothetical protein n=1 Tax=[Mycoplasma] cavipharyngis TaxID=92757 RepID=UPI003704AE79